MLSIVLGLASLALCAGSRQEDMTPGRSGSFRMAMNNPVDMEQSVLDRQLEESDTAETVAEDTEAETDAEDTEAETVAEAAQDPHDLLEAAVEMHNAVQFLGCRTLDDGKDTLELEEEWCSLRLCAHYLAAAERPGSLGPSLEQFGVKIPLKNRSSKVLEDLDERLEAVMEEVVGFQLKRYLDRHPKTLRWVESQIAKMPRPSDVYKLAIGATVATMEFGVEENAMLTKLWTIVRNNVGSGTAMQVTTADMMRWHHVRLRILADAGLERSYRDEWAIARHLLVLSAPFKSEPGQVIRRAHARKMLFCYVSEDGKSTLRGCEPVPTTSPVVQRALDIATELEMSDTARAAARSAAKAASRDMFDRTVSTAKRHMQKLEPASAAAKREDKAIRKKLPNVLKEAIMGR